MRQAWLAEIQSTACRRLGEIWLRAAGKNLLPRRAQLGARQLKDIIASVGVSERVNAETIVIRHQGERLRMMLGRSVTGVNSIELVPPGYRPVRIARFEACASRPCGMLSVAPAAWMTGQKTALESLVLPLLPDREGEPLLFITAFEEVHIAEFWPGDRLAVDDGLAKMQGTTRFLDLGNGIPDPDPGLALMPN